MQIGNLPLRTYLDLSRLVYAAWRRTPAGIPRVELAYAEHFIANLSGTLEFVVLDIFGRLSIVDKHRAADFVAAIAKYWRAEVSSRRAYAGIVLRALRIHAELLLQRWGSLARAVEQREECATYIIPSQLHIERFRLIERLKRSGKLRLVYFIHDILPTRFPEYFPPEDEETCRRRMIAAARLADVIVTNSQDTATAFREDFAPHRDLKSIVVAPPGITIETHRESTFSPAIEDPYFVMVGTIEPRKNHLLILNIWRELRAKRRDAAPRLVIIGARGWENENVVDMLERTPALRSFVHEFNRVSDADMARLLAGARALLMPSFAEGFGLPLAEALALKVPVLCSDIAVFREVGVEVPEFIDPLDGPRWLAAIEQYAAASSPQRQAQLDRLATWSAPTWQQHFDGLAVHLDAVAKS